MEKYLLKYEVFWDNISYFYGNIAADWITFLRSQIPNSLLFFLE